MILAKDYIIDIQNLNGVDLFNSKLRIQFIEKVERGFEEILSKNDNNGGSLETFFIESLRAFVICDVDVCFTHLEFLVGYCEERGIEKFQSNEFNLQVIVFYDYLKSIDNYSFFHIARVITYLSDYFIGEILFKNIILDLKNEKYFSTVDGTSVEYFKMYMEDLLLKSITFKTWRDQNSDLCEFLNPDRPDL